MSNEDNYKSIESISISAHIWPEVPLHKPASINPYAIVPAPEIVEVPLT
jgi:hypothetical protein